MVKTFYQVNDSKKAASIASTGENLAVVSSAEPSFAPKTFHQKQSLKPPPVTTAPMDSTPAPKALFQPTVQNSVDESSRQWLEMAIARLELNDYQFADTELSRANLLQTTMQKPVNYQKVFSINSIR